MKRQSKFRSKNVHYKSHNMLHELTLCAIIVFNRIFECLPHLSTPQIQFYVRSLSQAVNFTHRFNQKGQGGFPMPLKEGHLLVEKSRHWLSLWAWWSINYILDAVSIHPVTTKIQASFLTHLPERKETAQRIQHEPNGDSKTVTEFNGCDGRKLRMDPHHCSYSTILKKEACSEKKYSKTCVTFATRH